MKGVAVVPSHHGGWRLPQTGPGCKRRAGAFTRPAGGNVRRAFFWQLPTAVHSMASARVQRAPHTAPTVPQPPATRPTPPPAQTSPVLDFLRSPAAYARLCGGSRTVEVVQTHLSWVFLTDAYVFKLKKAICLPGVDNRSLATRERRCRDELRLNRRLAPSVYLGLIALQQRGDSLALAPAAARRDDMGTVDWLVWMRRLPEDRLLDRRLAVGAVAATDIDAVCDRLLAWYRRAPRARCRPQVYLARLQRELARSRAVLTRPEFALASAGPAVDRLAAALTVHEDLLRQRADNGRVVEGHGDLRPEHVCLLQPPVVIDALDFSRALREVDPVDELGYLGLECEFAGAAWVGPRLLARYAAATGDAFAPVLPPLYAAGRALLRARLSAAHLLDRDGRTPERWLPRARRYLALAERALDWVDVLDRTTAAAARFNAATRRGRR